MSFRRFRFGHVLFLLPVVLTALVVALLRGYLPGGKTSSSETPLSELLPHDLASEPDFPTTCLGEKNAPHQAIFLHGIMPIGKVPEALDYRARLARIAEEANYRIAMPLSRQLCQGNRKYCWNGSDGTTLLTTYSRILRSSAKCLSLDAPFGLIGFSNGGYHVTRVAMRCLAPRPLWILALGSAGDPSQTEGRELSGCPPTTLMIGTADITFGAAKALATALANSGLPVRFASFPGGHDVPDAALTAFLREQAR